MKVENRILQVRREEPSKERQIGRYYASELYDIYKGYLKPKDFFKQRKFDDKTLLTFEIGKMYHNHIQSFFPKENTEVSVKLQFDGFIITGRIDLLLDSIPCEFKTCSTLPKNYYLSHEIQLQTYLQTPGLKDFGYITYIEKNPRVFLTKNFKIEKNDFLFNSVIEKVKSFHEELVKVGGNK